MRNIFKYIAVAAFTVGSIASFAEQKVKEPLPIKAKSVILIFLAGGPSQTDTFDPKPDAGRDVYGSYKTPIKTNNDSLMINEHLQELSKIADKYSIIRSMTIKSNAHEIGQYLMYSGADPKSPVVYPSFGAVVSYLNPSGYSGKLPPYISLTKSSTRFNEGGFLGADYKPYNTGGSPEKAIFEVEGIINSRVNDAQLKGRRALLESIISSAPQAIESCAEVTKYRKLQSDNFDIILGESREVFNLKGEDKELREKYGMNSFGQSCLAARRLVEAGVPVVVVTYHGWDTHKEHFKRMNQRLGTLDKGVATLLNDLDSKGLLDSTIVLCGGEFGRTPRVMWQPPWNGGRGHFGAAFSYLVAGGGFQGGKVVGRTDPKGDKVVERPVRPADLIGSVYTLMGIDPYGTIPHQLLGEIPILPVLKDTVSSKGILTELLTE